MQMPVKNLTCLEPIDDETDQIDFVVSRNETHNKDWTNKHHIASTHPEQCPGHLHISALQLATSFLNPEISFVVRSLKRQVRINSYELCLRKLEDLMLVLQMVK